MKIKQTIKKIEEEIEKLDNEIQKYWKPSTIEHTKRIWKMKVLQAKLSGYKLVLKDILSEIDAMIKKNNQTLEKAKKNKLPKDWDGWKGLKISTQTLEELKKPIQEVLK